MCMSTLLKEGLPFHATSWDIQKLHAIAIQISSEMEMSTVGAVFGFQKFWDVEIQIVRPRDSIAASRAELYSEVERRAQWHMYYVSNFFKDQG